MLLANGRLPVSIKASVTVAFTCSSGGLISRVVLLSQNVKTNFTTKMLEFVLSELSNLGPHDFSQAVNYFLIIPTPHECIII